MIICFNCSEKLKTVIDGLVESGHYADYKDVIETALQNLSVIHNQVQDKPHMILGGDQDIATGRQQLQTENPLTSFANATHSDKNYDSVAAHDKTTGIPELCAPVNMNPDYEYAPDPEDRFYRGQMVAIDKWIFGQYNTLLPAKMSCRALAHLLEQNPEGVPLQQATASIVNDAVRLGDFLSAFDDSHGTKKEQALSTGFPTTAPGSEKSRLRFSRQFIGSIHKSGGLTGMLYDLKLINMVDSSRKLIALTEFGYRFASLKNPVLDQSQESPVQKFSSEEIDLFLAHIRYSVPVEDYAYARILGYIEKDINTPETLDTALQRHVPRDKRNTVSQSFLSSQRSGTVSRMTDLELITRHRNGVKFSYTITDRGRHFLKLRSFASLNRQARPRAAAR